MQICSSREFYCRFLQVKTINLRKMAWDLFLSQGSCQTGEQQAGGGIKYPKFQRTMEKEVPRFAINVLYSFRKVSTHFKSVLDE